LHSLSDAKANLPPHSRSFVVHENLHSGCQTMQCKLLKKEKAVSIPFVDSGKSLCYLIKFRANVQAHGFCCIILTLPLYILRGNTAFSQHLFGGLLRQVRELVFWQPELGIQFSSSQPTDEWSSPPQPVILPEPAVIADCRAK